MRFTYPLLLSSLIVTSCASHMPMNDQSNNIVSLRGPSSDESEEDYPALFEAMMNSNDPEKEFAGYFDNLKKYYLMSEASLGDFDHDLDEASSAQKPLTFDSSKSYKKLIVMWGYSHRLQDKMTYDILKVAQLTNDKNIPPSKRRMAKNIFKHFKKRIESSDPVEKLAFDELGRKTRAAIADLDGSSASAFGSMMQVKNGAVEQQEKINIVRQYREKFRSMGHIQQNSNDEMIQQIDADTEKLQLVNEDQSGREPQSDLKFYPSTGSNGNIMGLIFPKNVWALTYDDGPHPTYTPAIVKNLDELGIKATFFWLAENVSRLKGTVDLVKEHGNPQENHSWSHPQLPKLSAQGLQKEIVQSTALDTKVYGEKPRFFRCPYGAGSNVPRIRKMIADLNMIHVFWNVDTLDWQDKDPDSVFARAKKQMQAAGHGVILFHDIHPQSVVASKKLVEWSKTLKGTDAEIRWVTIPEIVDEMNGVAEVKK